MGRLRLNQNLLQHLVQHLVSTGGRGKEEEEPPVTQQPKGKPKGVKTTVVADIKMVDKLPNKSNTTVVADIKMVNKLPAGIIKKETYIGYSYI